MALLPNSRFMDVHQLVMHRLRMELPQGLFYHSPEHTEDVLTQAERIGREAHLDNRSLELLLLAALFHDTGFIHAAAEHETHSCAIARPYLADLQLNAAEIDAVCQAIMATRIPQSPTNLLGEILCDADLDYLGRDDFARIGDLLFLELKTAGKLQTRAEWDAIQIRFLRQHRYFTSGSIALRQDKKLIHLHQLEQQYPEI